MCLKAMFHSRWYLTNISNSFTTKTTTTKDLSQSGTPYSWKVPHPFVVHVLCCKKSRKFYYNIENKPWQNTGLFKPKEQSQDSIISLDSRAMLPKKLNCIWKTSVLPRYAGEDLVFNENKPYLLQILHLASVLTARMCLVVETYINDCGGRTSSILSRWMQQACCSQ